MVDKQVKVMRTKLGYVGFPAGYDGQRHNEEMRPDQTVVLLEGE